MESTFTKIKHVPIKNGLAGELGMELFGTLVVLATFIDKDGRCYPTQDHLARLTGVTRNTVSKRLNKLCNYYYNGKPLLTKEQHRNGAGTFTNTVYTVNTEVFSIF